MIQTEANPTHIVDAATLTGSIVRALGTAITGFFCTDSALADAIISCGDKTGEPFWQMPLLGDYREQLDHPVADIDNVGKDANGGAIKAALFLKEFVKPEVKWAHMDIAGTALLTKPWRYYESGATGIGVRTMVCLAQKLASQ
jgi:leucyl aminopeptidase